MRQRPTVYQAPHFVLLPPTAFAVTGAAVVMVVGEVEFPVLPVV